MAVTTAAGAPPATPATRAGANAGAGAGAGALKRRREDSGADAGAGRGRKTAARQRAVSEALDLAAGAALATERPRGRAGASGAAGCGVTCREAEHAAMLKEMQRVSRTRRAGVIFTSGVPGVGKSLTTAAALSAAEAWARSERMPAPAVAWVNCMALRAPEAVWEQALAGLEPEQGAGPIEPHVAAARVRKRFNNRPPGQEKPLKPVAGKGAGGGRGGKHPQRMPVIVLDELDAMLRGAEGLASLCALFAMVTAPGAHGLIVGVANALDFAIHARDELRAAGIEPAEVVMPAYTAAELTTLLGARLGEEVAEGTEEDPDAPRFVPQALQLCARRVAAATGDMRRALQVCTAALERAQAQQATQLAAASGSGAPKKRLTVTVSHMAAALSAVLRDQSSSLVKKLPPQQQLLLAAVVRRVERNAAGPQCLVSELRDTYVQLCAAARLAPLAEPEMSTVISVLSDQGLVAIAGNSRAYRKQKVALRVPAEDIESALSNSRMLQGVAKGVGRAC